MSLRYYVGYSLVLASRLFKSVVDKMYWLAMLPERFAVIVWTPREIDRYARVEWSSSTAVGYHSRADDWLGVSEKTLTETYFMKDGDLLNLACGAGREALLLARRGMRVTACDWSPRMIAEARHRAQEANLPIRFAVADLCDLPYHEKAFDYLFLTNVAYSLVFPRHRRMRFLKQAYSLLRPGGVFIVSFACAPDGLQGEGRLQRLFMKLRRIALFNQDYEPGDSVRDPFIHLFQPEEVRREFEEVSFIITDWLWRQSYAVLTKG